MGIQFDESKAVFKLDTENSTYLIGILKEGYLGHIYYGEKLKRFGGHYLLRMEEKPYTPSVNNRDKISFLDSFPMEYPTGGIGDYRESCLNVQDENGSTGCEIFYKKYCILDKKPPLVGLPSAFSGDEKVETLEIFCEDTILDIQVILSYSVFYDEDVITRNVRIKNKGNKPLKLEKVYTACLDMDNRDFEVLTLCGAWARERHIQRNPIHYGKQNVSSIRGGYNHQEHPFIALLTPDTTQESGEVYGMHFVYSGNFIAQAELTQFDKIRMVMGIHSEGFSWNLKSGEEFQTPEVVLTYSKEGIGKMSRSFHDFYREHMIRSSYKYKKRPVLINNWEATYFDFNSEKLLDIAKEARKNGIEMLVMDDGWFGKRNSDDNSLGDWVVNKSKITSGLSDLVKKVNEIGLEFGIWFEPEMVSPDSDLYRKHPDWAIQIQERNASQMRAQYVLDLSNPEVREYIYDCLSRILKCAPIRYVKWDMNRHISDVGSVYLDKENQKELLHRYVLGLYELQERLITDFPELLLENCSGGGGRFDPGMLYYSPQIWCSDNTDAIERLHIQEGTELIYPLSTIGAHISDCPNHSVGRTTPFVTRGHVALAGTFGYELDITKITEEDRSCIPGQVKLYKQYQSLIQKGDYYRITSWNDKKPYDCWSVVSKDKSEALVTYVQVLSRPNIRSNKIKLQGLCLDIFYQLEGTEEIYTGEELMKCGFLVKDIDGDFVSRLYHFVKIKNN